jgi:hypothetical protein
VSDNFKIMTIQEVRSTQDWKLFHSLPHRIYKNDPNWICPLEGDVQGTFTPGKNNTLHHGEAKCFILTDEQGQPLGRIAAFIDHRNNQLQPYPIGGIGYFECIDDDACARLLFQAAEAYLQEKGIKAVDGPINFGGRDKFWGLLVKGFSPPLFQENYQPTYYQRFFADNGYLPFEQILTMKGKMDVDMSRFKAVIDRISRNNNIRVETYDYKKLDRYAEDFAIVYNAAFGGSTHFRPAEPAGFKKIMKEAAMILEPKLLAIAYCEEEPAGFCAFFPDINPILKPMKGKMQWWKIPGFLYRLRTAKTMGCRGTGFGVNPKFKTKGIFAFIVDFMNTDYLKRRYPDFYCTTVRAHNTEAVNIYYKMGTFIERVHIAYRKSFDPNIEVIPNMFLELED